MLRTSCLHAVLVTVLVGAPHLAAQQPQDDVRFRSGNLQVKLGAARMDNETLAYHMILRDQISFGWCFDDAKYRRMPVTYYHPQGPIGLVFQKFNWFPGAVNTYHADVRLPASLVALGFPPPQARLPVGQLVALWSEPPVGVIGMAAGTPAAYARPLQCFDFYEPTREVIELNQPKGKEHFFHFIPDAQARGAQVRVFHGAPRAQLRERGPHSFYHVLLLEACSGEDGEKIFLPLFTKEGIAQCLEHLVDDGILCVHTSHRFVDLPPVLGAIGRDLKLHVRRGHDEAPVSELRRRRGNDVSLEEVGHFTSEWVLLARHPETLEAVCKSPPNYEEMVKETRPGSGGYWMTPVPLKEAWTDKGPNLLHGVLRGHPFAMRYSAAAGSCVDILRKVTRSVGLGESQFLLDLYNLPRPVDEWLVRNQLSTNPRVEGLWK